MVTAQGPGWRFHQGVTTVAERERVLGFMVRRWWCALRRHRWRHVAAQAVVFGTAFGLLASSLPLMGGAPLAVTVPVGIVAMGVLLVPFAHLFARMLRRRRLTRHAPSWTLHWCEGPNGELGARWTERRLATGREPERWYGMDLFGGGGAGDRLLRWLQAAVDAERAVLVIRTTQPELVAKVYQRAGMTVVERPRRGLNILRTVPFTLMYPSTTTWRPHRSWTRRLVSRRVP